MESAISIRDLSVCFQTRQGPIRALDGVTLDIQPGQVFGFLGPNGAGKTTTMHLLLGFIKPTRGQALLFGTDVQQSIARQRLGYLPEHPDTYRFLTGLELLRLTGRLFKLNRQELRERIATVLEEVDLVEAATRRIGTYSRGMMQRICLAQALIHDPDLLILDEPTGGLDPLGRLAIRNIIAKLRDRGKTVFFSSHELSEVELICDTIAILAKGKVVAQGNAKDLVGSDESLERYFMRVVQEDGGPQMTDHRPQMTDHGPRDND